MANVCPHTLRANGAPEAGGCHRREPHVVVGWPGRDGRRRVRIGVQIAGMAYGPRDVLECLRRWELSPRPAPPPCPNAPVCQERPPP